MDMVKDNKARIVKTQSASELARETLNLFLEAARKAIEDKGIFYVAISGGHTPAAFYELLSDKSVYSQLDWSKVHLFWVDERCVLPSADASNFGLAVHTFLLDIPIPGENIHRMTGENTDYAAAAEEYEQVIRSVFHLSPGQMPQFDLVMLGMGADGHIGSLLPNTNALFDTKSIVCTVYRMDSDYSRITLTMPVIKEADQIVVMISGQAKAEIVREVFQSEPDEVKYPVHFLWPVMNKITWLIDQQAASLVT